MAEYEDGYTEEAKSIVYVVTTGEYSAYGIHGVFSSREKAEAFVRECGFESDGIEYDIEEWPIDALVGHVYRSRWLAIINLLSGTVKVDISHRWMAHPMMRSDTPERFKGDGRVDSIRVGSYVSAKHAAKLAVEYRQKWLREQGSHNETKDG